MVGFRSIFNNEDLLVHGASLSACGLCFYKGFKRLQRKRFYCKTLCLVELSNNSFKFLFTNISSSSKFLFTNNLSFFKFLFTNASSICKCSLFGLSLCFWWTNGDFLLIPLHSHHPTYFLIFEVSMFVFYLFICLLWFSSLTSLTHDLNLKFEIQGVNKLNDVLKWRFSNTTW